MTQYDISSRQDRRPRHRARRSWSVLPYHAALSRLRPSSPRSAWRSCSAASTPRWCGTSTPSSGPSSGATLTKFFVGTAHFLAHLTAMFTLSLLIVVAQQPDDAADREAARCPLQGARGAGADRARRHPGRRWSRCSASRRRSSARGGAPTEQAGAAARPTPVRELVGFTSLSDPDDRARRAGRRLAVGLLLGADRAVRAHARGGGVRRPAHQELQELPAHQVRAGQAHHLSARASTRCRAPTIG